MTSKELLTLRNNYTAIIPLAVGEQLRLLKAGTDLIKVKKSKGLPRVFRLEDDLLAVAWESMNKKPIRARSNDYMFCVLMCVF